MRIHNTMLPISLVLSTIFAEAQTPIGQGSSTGTTLATRCFGNNARFNYGVAGDYQMHGPSGLAIDPGGRIFATDFGGRRVLTWPSIDERWYCPTADSVIGNGELAGPEAVAIDPTNGAVFIADTLDHTIKGYLHVSGQISGYQGGYWRRFVTLGTPGVAGSSNSQFNFPRGLAFDAGGRLFVADDYNKRVLIFNRPFRDGQGAADSIGAYANGGFSSPKALAISGNTLFVADFYNNRVLRFTGPFNTPDQVYAASGVFTGFNNPVDLAMHPDGSLLVTDQGNRRILRFADASWTTETRNAVRTYSGVLNAEPLGVAADRKGRIYAADYRAYRIVTFEDSVRTEPVTASASNEARVLLAELHARTAWPQNRVALGQQLRTWSYGSRWDPNGWYDSGLKLEQSGSRLPQILGGEVRDLMSYPGFYPNQDALSELISHGRRGGIVTLVWHPDNPTNGAYGTPISTQDLTNMFRLDTEVGQRWRTQMDRAAGVLQSFKNANVPVMFRPLHEQNGTFFWWGHDGSTGDALRARQEAWVRMWREMVTQFNTRYGLNNVLFVFGTNQVNYQGVAAPLTYYPGGMWADVVSIDVYQERLNLAGAAPGVQHYAALVGTGKPFGLAEFGQSFDENGTGPNDTLWDSRILVTRIVSSYPRTAFAIAWYSSVVGGVRNIFALPDVAYGRELLANEFFQTR